MLTELSAKGIAVILDDLAINCFYPIAKYIILPSCIFSHWSAQYPNFTQIILGDPRLDVTVQRYFIFELSQR